MAHKYDGPTRDELIHLISRYNAENSHKIVVGGLTNDDLAAIAIHEEKRKSFVISVIDSYINILYHMKRNHPTLKDQPQIVKEKWKKIAQDAKKLSDALERARTYLEKRADEVRTAAPAPALAVPKPKPNPAPQLQQAEVHQVRRAQAVKPVEKAKSPRKLTPEEQYLKDRERAREVVLEQKQLMAHFEAKKLASEVRKFPLEEGGGGK